MKKATLFNLFLYNLSVTFGRNEKWYCNYSTNEV